MSITPQLPPIPLAVASPGLRALAQGAGQVVEARVLGQQANGTTQVMVGRQVFNLQLPDSQLPGTMLTLAVRQAEGQLQLALISAQPPAALAANAGSAPAAGSVPATQVQLSAAALSAGTLAPLSPTPVAAGQTMVAPNIAPSPLPAPSGTASPSQPVVVPNQAMTQGQNAVGAGLAAMRQPTEPSPGIAPGPGVARPPIPYATAPAAQMPAPPAQSAVATGTTLAPLGQAAGATVTGQHAAAPQVQGAGGQAGGVATAQPAPPQASPQVALSRMVQQALPRQDSIVGLTNALSAMAGRVALPEPVLKAAQQVLGRRLVLDGAVDGAAMRRAVQNSGIFQEALLASGQARLAGGDLKTALLGLQRQLGAWLGNQPPVEQVGTIAPPLRGMAPRARSADMPLADVPEDVEGAGKVLLERTEAALARLRLHQNASLPEASTQRHEAQWSLDLPVSLAGQQALLHLHIHGDADRDEARPEERGWQVRFAINLGETGEMGAQISLRGKITAILIWAERPDVAAELAEGVNALRSELEALGLTPGSIVVRTGAPMPPNQAPAKDFGHILDAMR